MENALQTINGNAAIAENTDAMIFEYFDAQGITDKLLDREKKMFLNIAKEFGLNPFKRELHITAFGSGDNRKCSIITGYEVYIKRAERTGKLDGWEIKTEGNGKDLKAVVKIYRKDMKYPFVHEVYYSECVQLNREGNPNAVWAKQPRFMTKKVAIGQAFRLCFSDDLGGMPYEESEMPQEERNVTEQLAQVQPEEKEPENPLEQLPPAEEEIKILKRQTWELIKKLPEEFQTKWINLCKDADTEKKLTKIIKDLEELLYEYEEAKKALEEQKAKEAAEKSLKEETEIW